MPINVTSPTPISPILLDPIPFENKKYTGSIHFNFNKNDNSYLISAIGERISLETFTEPYHNGYKNKFSFLSYSRSEFAGLQKIFQNPENVKQYAGGKVNSNEEIIKRLDRDSRRPLNGDMFSGFAIVDNKTNEVIGRAAVGSGDEAEESQFGLIIRSDYHGKKIGKEAAILMAAVALAFFENKCPVPHNDTKAPVRVFRATILDTNNSRHLIQQGMNCIKPLPTTLFQRVLCTFGINKLLNVIGFPLNMRSFYEIRGEDIRPKLAEFMDISKLHINIQ